MKRLLALVLLTACAKAPPPDEQQSDIPGLLRNPTAPLASQTDVTANRLEGEWYIRQAAFGQKNSFLRFDIGTQANGDLLLSLCDVLECVPHVLKQSGLGRWMIEPFQGVVTALPKGDIWVLWMDFDDRTVVFGDPLGRHVWILDRQPEGGLDRIAAARDILDWYGYDLSQLETTQ